jgi:hypothetical protein
MYISGNLQIIWWFPETATWSNYKKKWYCVIITLKNSYFSNNCLKPSTQLVMWLDALCLNMTSSQTTSHGFYELCIYSVMDGSKDDIL